MRHLAIHKMKKPLLLFGLFVLIAMLIEACGPAIPQEGSEPSTSNVTVPAANDDGDSSSKDMNDGNSNEATTASSPPATVELDIEDSSIEFDANGIEVGFTNDGHPYKGDPNAPVVLEEFSDFQCPFCARFYDQALPALTENQIANGEVVLVFYDFPLTSIHAQAVAAANAARCAGEQSARSYWQMHDLIFENMGEWTNSNVTSVLANYAQGIGLDVASFEECQNSERYYEQIQADLDLGRSRGVQSTPSFFLNDQLLVGAQPLSTFNQAISAVLSGQQIASDERPSDPPSQPQVKPTPVTISTGDEAAIMGESDAAVTIVEYTDYQCPFCQRHNQETMPQLISTMIETGRVRYVLKDFPLDRIHPEARSAATAARCAGEQEAYWEMHDAIFVEQSAWAGQGQNVETILANMAAELNLDLDAYIECVSSDRYSEAIQANLDEGTSLGVGGTPYFFINGFPINGAQPFELFEYAISLAEEGTLADAYVPPPDAEQEQAPPEPTGPVDVPIAESPSIGDPDAPVVIVEYTDFQCPFCSRHFQQTMPQIKANYIDTGLVRYVFKDFPLTSIHAQAVAAAEAARCAGDQGAYVEMHDALFANQGEWQNQDNATEIFAGYAGQLDLDVDSFDQCLNSRKYEETVMADLEEGVGFGVRGTPAFFINGHFLSGAQPYSTFEQAINSLLAD